MSKESEKYNMDELGFNMVKALVYDQTFSGEQSFAELALVYLRRKLESLEPFDSADIEALLRILNRTAGSMKAINVICGDPKGAPKKGRNSFQNAMNVYVKHKFENLSVNKACEQIEADEEIPFNTVENHWEKWKDKIDLYVNLYRETSEQANTNNY